MTAVRKGTFSSLGFGAVFVPFEMEFVDLTEACFGLEVVLDSSLRSEAVFRPKGPETWVRTGISQGPGTAPKWIHRRCPKRYQNGSECGAQLSHACVLSTGLCKYR